MQLTYRGVKYNTTEPTVEVKETEEIAQYRGVSYHLHQAIAQAVRASTDVLVYRGAIVH